MNYKKMTLILTMTFAAILVSISGISSADAGFDNVLSLFEINTTTPNGPDLDNDDRFGFSIANIGDINNDGTDDIVVGAAYDDAGGIYGGAVHIITLNGTGYPLKTVEINPTTPNGPVLSSSDNFGYSIANIGDIDDNGINDIAVSAVSDDTNGINRGTIYIITLNSDGSPKKTVKIDDATPNGPHLINYDQFGSSIANIGDIDGDGIDDIAVGTTGDDTGGSAAGAVYIITLNSTGYPITTVKIDSTTANGPDISEFDFFGSSIANIGDINNDGINDIAVGADGPRPNSDTGGAVHIITLNSTGYPITTVKIDSTTANGPVYSNNYRFGHSIANIGDINGDQINDIAVGAYGDYDYRGAFYIITLNGTGYPTSTVKTDAFTSGFTLSSNDRFGSAIANIGDRNGDGINDIAVGAFGDSTNGDNQGTLYIMMLFRITTVPDSPGNFSATAGDALVDLIWSKPSNYGNFVSDYIVEYGNGTAWTIFNDGISTVTSATINNLTNDQQYWFRVSAVNDIGTGNATSPITATPFYTLYCEHPESYYANIIHGTASSEYLVGTKQNDLIFGYAGNDFIRGSQGNDCIYGGIGDDYIQGGSGHDTIYAGSGNDIVRTGPGNDTVYGEDGNDILHAVYKNGSNLLDGGSGSDMCIPENTNVNATSINCEITQ